MAAVSIWVPRSPRDEFHHIPPLQKTFQDQQVGLAQASFKLLLPWVPEWVGFCVCPLREESLFPTALWLSQK